MLYYFNNNLIYNSCKNLIEMGNKNKYVYLISRLSMLGWIDRSRKFYGVELI